jgi:hemolysin III
VARTSLSQHAAAAAATVKPRLRGWLHAGMFPLAVAGSIVLVALSPTSSARIANTVFGLTAAMLFGTSAVYHLGTWSPRVTGVLRRLDHSNIFLIIAGTYTPLAVLLLPTHTATVLLWTVWIGAVVYATKWPNPSPRWFGFHEVFHSLTVIGYTCTFVAVAIATFSSR